MIADCTRMRLAGEWAGALRAARIDADIDLARVAVANGAPAAGRIEADLRGLAPDLLLWHLPRDIAGGTGAPAGEVIVLTTAERLAPGEPVLALRPPGGVTLRLRLEVTTPTAVRLEWPVGLPPCLWHAGHAHLLRQAHGGSALRLPRFQPEGTPLPRDRFARRPSPGDPVSLAEAMHELCLQGRAAEAMRLAGLDLDAAVADRMTSPSWLGPNPVGLAEEIRRLAYWHDSVHVTWHSQVWEIGASGRILGRARRPCDPLPLARLQWPLLPPDPDLVWHGLVTPQDLHPLVRSALFPEG